MQLIKRLRREGLFSLVVGRYVEGLTGINLVCRFRGEPIGLHQCSSADAVTPGNGGDRIAFDDGIAPGFAAFAAQRCRRGNLHYGSRGGFAGRRDNKLLPVPNAGVFFRKTIGGIQGGKRYLMLAGNSRERITFEHGIAAGASPGACGGSRSCCYGCSRRCIRI